MLCTYEKGCALLSKVCAPTRKVKSLTFKLNYKKFSSAQESEITCTSCCATEGGDSCKP